MSKLMQVWNQGKLYTYAIDTQRNTIIIVNSQTANFKELEIESPIKYGDDVRDLIDKHMI